MAADVVRSIGTGAGRDYSTIQAWEDAAPADLVAADQRWIGECYNDSEFVTAGITVTIAGGTTDATRYKLLRCAAGQSFRDHADKATNPLTYDATKGVGLRHTNSYTITVSIGESYTHLDGLQIGNTGLGNSGGFVLVSSTGVTGIVIDNCLFDGNVRGIAIFGRGGLTVRNSSIFCRNTLTNAAGLRGESGGTFVNVTVARDVNGAAATRGLDSSYGTINCTNVAVFGFAILRGGSGSAAYTTCATDLASPPAGVTGGLVYADQFEGITAAACDLRLKAGSALIDAGTTDATNAATDIVGTARPQGSAYDIGAWEYAAAGGGSASTGDLSVQLADAVPSAAGSLALDGALSVALDDATLSATGSLAIGATASVQLADAVLVATGTNPNGGTPPTPAPVGGLVRRKRKFRLANGVTVLAPDESTARRVAAFDAIAESLPAEEVLDDPGEPPAPDPDPEPSLPTGPVVIPPRSVPDLARREAELADAIAAYRAEIAALAEDARARALVETELRRVAAEQEALRRHAEDLARDEEETILLQLILEDA